MIRLFPFSFAHLHSPFLVLMDQVGLEPTASCLWGRCSNQLSYWSLSPNSGSISVFGVPQYILNIFNRIYSETRYSGLFYLTACDISVRRTDGSWTHKHIQLGRKSDMPNQCYALGQEVLVTSLPGCTQSSKGTHRIRTGYIRERNQGDVFQVGFTLPKSIACHIH